MRMRAEVEAINEWIEAFELSLAEGCPLAIDPRDRSLRRIFNRGSWREGGRLYGGFWQPMSKEERFALIRIGGEPIAELDYKQMYPRLLYAMAGAHLPEGDLYAVPGLEGRREGVKCAFNSLMFGGKFRRYPRGKRHLFPPSLAARKCVSLITKRHPAIARHFGTEVGFELMHRESEVLLRVLNRCRETETDALPIHDAILVRASQAAGGRKIMEEALREEVGEVVDGAVEVKGAL